jgi:hypothetical protein
MRTTSGVTHRTRTGTPLGTPQYIVVMDDDGIALPHPRVMKPFTAEDEGSERLVKVRTAIWDLLVPDSGACLSVQGELVRAHERLGTEYYRNGMCNYYVSAELKPDQYYAKLLGLLLRTLVENRTAALTTDDVAFFRAFGDEAAHDFALFPRQQELEDKEENDTLTETERTELERLRDAPQPDWEELYARGERCIVNWCIANPDLVDAEGKPVVERGVTSLRDLFARHADVLA